jgi:hypothetical protein
LDENISYDQMRRKQEMVEAKNDATPGVQAL